SGRSLVRSQDNHRTAPATVRTALDLILLNAHQRCAGRHDGGRACYRLEAAHDPGCRLIAQQNQAIDITIQQNVHRLQMFCRRNQPVCGKNILYAFSEVFMRQRWGKQDFLRRP
ncbi:hypothetical protein, partial [Propionivibrio sp.]|uniref:hypothetical protein n=1 Tax=Propionivibrio sp. TaxID=2212460 RepID=UPI003BF1A834